MDPNENLNEQLQLARRIIEFSGPSDTSYFDDCQRLAELVVSLDEWLKKDGMLPKKWWKSRA